MTVCRNEWLGHESCRNVCNIVGRISWLAGWSVEGGEASASVITVIRIKIQSQGISPRNRSTYSSIIYGLFHAKTLNLSINKE